MRDDLLNRRVFNILIDYHVHHYIMIEFSPFCWCVGDGFNNIFPSLTPLGEIFAFMECKLLNKRMMNIQTFSPTSVQSFQAFATFQFIENKWLNQKMV